MGQQKASLGRRSVWRGTTGRAKIRVSGPRNSRLPPPRPNFSRQKLPQEKKRWALPTRLSFSSLPEPGIKPRIFFKLFHLHCLRPFGSYARLQKLTLMETAFHQKEFWAKGMAPKKSILNPKLVELKLRKESEKLSTNLFLNLGENIFYQDFVLFF